MVLLTHFSATKRRGPPLLLGTNAHRQQHSKVWWQVSRTPLLSGNAPNGLLGSDRSPERGEISWSFFFFPSPFSVYEINSGRQIATRWALSSPVAGGLHGLVTRAPDSSDNIMLRQGGEVTELRRGKQCVSNLQGCMPSSSQQPAAFQKFPVLFLSAKKKTSPVVFLAFGIYRGDCNFLSHCWFHVSWQGIRATSTHSSFPQRISPHDLATNVNWINLLGLGINGATTCYDGVVWRGRRVHNSLREWVEWECNITNIHTYVYAYRTYAST